MGAVTHTALLCGEGEPVESLAAALDGEPIAVVRAPDAVDALERLATDGADCVVTPARVGRLSATEFVDELRSRGHGVPAVLLVADDDPATVLAADVDEALPADDPATAASGVRDLLASERLDEATENRRRLRAAVSAAEEAMADAEGEAAIEDALARTLAERPVYRSAWVGRYDEGEATVSPTVAVGLPAAHLADRPVRGATAAAVEDGRVGVEGDETETTLVVPLGDGPAGILYLNADRAGGVSDVERDLLADLGETAGATLRRATEGADEADAEGADDDEVNGGEGAASLDVDGLTVLGDALAHELSNQLDVATTHLDLGRDADDGDEHFGHVEDALDRLSGLADEASALARGDVDREPCALAEVAEEAWARVDAGDAELETEPARMWADEEQLTVMLENLLRNAVEHGPDGAGPDDDAGDEGSIRVRVAPLDDGGFVVADDGQGVPESDREAVLEWGYSGGEGAGVGLGIVQLVARRHDWSVDVGESADGGAAFTVR